MWSSNKHLRRVVGDFYLRLLIVGAPFPAAFEPSGRLQEELLGWHPSLYVVLPILVASTLPAGMPQDRQIIRRKNLVVAGQPCATSIAVSICYPHGFGLAPRNGGYEIVARFNRPCDSEA